MIGVHLNAATMGFIPMGPIAPEEIATFNDAREGRGCSGCSASWPSISASTPCSRPVRRRSPTASRTRRSGLLAWISELFTSFGDRVEAVDRDAFLTNFLIYWFTGTAASSVRLYYENAHDPEAWAPKANSGVPTGVAVFGFDEVPIRRYGESQQHHRALDRVRRRRALRGAGSAGPLGRRRARVLRRDLNQNADG